MRQQKRHWCIEQSFGLWGEGEGGMIWENGIETCIISYMKRVTSPGSMHDTGCLGLVYWDDPEGWYGEGGGRREEGSGWGTHVYLWRIHFDIWQNQYNIVKFEKKKKLNIQKTKIMESGPTTSWETNGGTVETVSDFIFGAPKSLQMVSAAMKLKDACSLEENL